MQKTLIASVLMIAVAANGLGATPARASDDVAKVIAGATALYLLGRTLKKSGDNNYTQQSRAITQPSYSQPYYNRQTSHRRPQPYYDNNRNSQCLRRKFHDGRWVTYRDKQCLKRYGNYRAEKPRECLRKRWTREGWVKYYDRTCLSRTDYRTGNSDEHAYERDNHHRRSHD